MFVSVLNNFYFSEIGQKLAESERLVEILRKHTHLNARSALNTIQVFLEVPIA